MNTIISIDGACRRNGQPDCLSAGGVFIRAGSFTTSMCTHECNSTNQRGELHALILGLGIGLSYLSPTNTIYLITDSEYIANTINKEWYKSWQRKGWVTASGDPVKNRDLWERAAELLGQYGDDNFVVYSVKGHVISFGKATANGLLVQDVSAGKLYVEVAKKYDTAIKKDVLDAAIALFERTYGFTPPMDIFREMVICNTVSDLLAGAQADKMDYLR